jgi:hypothetical protein
MKCSSSDCSREVTNKKRGFCSRCYQYWLQTEAPHKPRCPVDGCDRPQWAKGMCNIHYSRSERGLGSTDGIGRGAPGRPRGKRNLDGRYVTSNGYVKVRIADKWDLEHRVVLSNSLGRELFPGETAHHKDGNKQNNDPSNLELWVTKQPSGQRPEDLVKWAHEILERYDG